VSWKDAIGNWQQAESADWHRRMVTKRHWHWVGSGKLPLTEPCPILKTEGRSRLLDEIAKLVDEDYVGRSEMFFQFADLLQRALTKIGIQSRPVVGNAIYYDKNGAEIHRWKHAWIRVGNEVIDGNVDSIFENPMVPLLPQGLKLAPYWGPVRDTPPDRKLQEHHGATLPPDDDVENIWWPELSAVIDLMMDSPATGV
jgi:hypothetical protein